MTKSKTLYTKKAPVSREQTKMDIAAILKALRPKAYFNRLDIKRAIERLGFDYTERRFCYFYPQDHHGASVVGHVAKFPYYCWNDMLERFTADELIASKDACVFELQEADKIYKSGLSKQALDRVSKKSHLSNDGHARINIRQLAADEQIPPRESLLTLLNQLQQPSKE